MLGYNKILKKFLIQIAITAIITFCILFAFSYFINGKDSIEYVTIIIYTIMTTVILSFISQSSQLILMGKAFMVSRSEKENVNLNVTKDSIVYYREIPKGYSPAIASLLLDLSTEYERDIISTILNLTHRGYLKKNIDNILVIDKINNGELLPHEKMIIDNISLKNFNVIKWKNQVIQDAIDMQLIENIKNKITFLNMFYILFGITLFIIVSINNGGYIFNIIKLFAGIIFIPYIFFLISYLASRKKYNFTTKGNIEHEKMKKLKDYIEDFSFLSDSDENQITVWEEFLIYSISLGVNKKIYSDEKIINILKNIDSTLCIEDFQNISKLNDYMLTNFR